jgi:hypothetical protein
MVMLVLTNLKKYKNAANRALADTVDEAASANQQAMQSDRYDWPRFTIRKNGEVVGTPRNIDDLSNLIGSLQLAMVDSDMFELSWGGAEAPYAPIVFYGATLRNGTHLPARKWIYEALRGDRNAPTEWRNPDAILNVPEFFAERFKIHAGL